LAGQARRCYRVLLMRFYCAGLAGDGPTVVEDEREVISEKRSEDDAIPEGLELPSFSYYLDESDPDIVVLRRQDGALVATFSARGATTEGLVEAAQQDYRALLRHNAGSLGPAVDEV
jgi:hypothetical protein